MTLILTRCPDIVALCQASTLLFTLAKWRHTQCNSYHQRKWYWQPEFKSEMSLFGFLFVFMPLGKTWIHLSSAQLWRENSFGVMAKVQDCNLKVNKFTLQLGYYVHFATNTVRKGMNPIIIFTNPSARAGYDTRSIFKRSLTGLNSEFSFS